MQYKITKQYAKDAERPLAEFNNLTDSELFVLAKCESDNSKALKLIYRLFDYEKLLCEYNKEKFNVPLGRAQYAQGDLDLPHYFAEPFKVIIENKHNEQTIIAKFCDIEDTRLFIDAKFRQKNSYDDQVYFIYKNKEFVEKIDQNSIDSDQPQSQGKEQKAAFRPTPFATTLRLGPPKWVVEEEDENSKKSG